MSMNASPYYGYNNCGILYATAEQSNPSLAAQRALDLYNLRARNAAIETAQQHHGNFQPSNNKRERKTQTNRSRTLYNKRLLVNARERERMKTLNKGFENLRNALPCYIADGHISKITTLRLAINYIKTLSAVLQDGTSTADGQEALGGPLMEQTLCSDHENSLTNAGFSHLKNADLIGVLPVPDSNPGEVVETHIPRIDSTLSIPQKTE